MLRTHNDSVMRLHRVLFCTQAAEVVTPTVRLLADVLELCNPLVFWGQQFRFYSALERRGAFVAAEAPEPRTALRCFGVQYGADHGERYVATRTLLAQLCELLADDRELRHELNDMCELPYAVARAVLFFKAGAASDGFCLRHWLASRFFPPNNQQVLDWMDPHSAEGLQSPEYVDMVYMRFAGEDAWLSARVPEVVNVQEMALARSSSLAFNATVRTGQSPQVLDPGAISTPRMIWTFFVYFVHRIAYANGHGLALSAAMRDARQLLEPCACMLLGATDRATIELLQRLDTDVLRTLSAVAEEFRLYLADPLAAPRSSLLSSLMRRTADFDHLYINTLHSESLIVAGDIHHDEQYKRASVEPTYAPVEEVGFARFYAGLQATTQVLQLRRLHNYVPTLWGADPALFDGVLSVWRLPANVRLHRVEWSLEFYRALLRPYAQLDRPVVGLDTGGVYVVMQRDAMHLLQIVMFVHSMRARSFTKSAAAYPLLARLYTADYSATPAIGLFARHAVVQVLARWLMLSARSILHTPGVPSAAVDSPAARVLGRLHEIAHAAKQGGPDDYYRVLTALRDALLLQAQHWIPLEALTELDDATADALAATPDPDPDLVEAAHLLRALRLHHEATHYPPLAGAGAGAGTGGGARRKRTAHDAFVGGAALPLFSLDDGAAPLAVCSGANLGDVARYLPAGHALGRCASDEARLELVNACVYTCILACPAPQAGRLLCTLRTAHKAIDGGSYARAMYACTDDVVDSWARCEAHELCPPPSDRAQYRARPAVAGCVEQLAGLLQLLQRLETCVCTPKKKRDTRKPASDPATAACLAAFYASREGRAMPLTAVATYDDAASAQRRVATFDMSMCLVDVATSSAMPGDTAAQLRARRRTFGAQSSRLHDTCINMAGALFAEFRASDCTRRELAHRCLTATLEAKGASASSSGDAWKQPGAQLPPSPARVVQ